MLIFPLAGISQFSLVVLCVLVQVILWRKIYHWVYHHWCWGCGEVSTSLHVLYVLHHRNTPAGQLNMWVSCAYLCVCFSVGGSHAIRHGPIPDYHAMYVVDFDAFVCNCFSLLILPGRLWSYTATLGKERFSFFPQKGKYLKAPTFLLRAQVQLLASHYPKSHHGFWSIQTLWLSLLLDTCIVPPLQALIWMDLLILFFLCFVLPFFCFLTGR